MRDTHTHAERNADCNTHGDIDRHAECRYTHSHADCNTNSYTDRNTHEDIDRDADYDTLRNSYSRTDANPNTRAGCAYPTCRWRSWAGIP